MAGITQTGDWRKLQQSLEGLSRIDTRGMHRVIAATLLSSTRQRFRREEGPDGRSWPKSNRVKREGGHTLRRRGDLYLSLTRASGREFAAVGTNKLGAALQHFGGTVRPRRAKALSIPLTKESEDLASPRQFPTKLSLVWPKGKSRGFLVEDQPAGKGRSKLGARSVFQFMLVRKMTVPSRPFLGINDRDIHNIKSDIRTWLKRRMQS